METPFGILKSKSNHTGPGTLCWRPEVVTLGGELRGRVSSSAFQGGYLDVFVTAGGETLRLQLPGSIQVAVEDDLSFSIAPEDVVQLEDAPGA